MSPPCKMHRWAKKQTFYVYTTNLIEWPSSTHWVSWLLSSYGILNFCCSRQADSQYRPLHRPRYSARPLPLAYDLKRLTLISTFDLDLWPWPLSKEKDDKLWWLNMIFSIWPWPLTYDLDLQSQPTKNEGCRSIGLNRTAGKYPQTNGQADRRYQFHYLPTSLSFVGNEPYLSQQL